MKTKEEIIEHLHKIDEEIRSLIVTKTTPIYNSLMGRQAGSIKRSFYKDRYKVIALKAERQSYIQKLKDLSSQTPGNESLGDIKNMEDKDAEAVRYGVQLYIEEEKPKRLSKISKNRTIAVKVVDIYFPQLSGKLRKQKIDSLRGRIQSAVKKKMKLK